MKVIKRARCSTVLFLLLLFWVLVNPITPHLSSAHQNEFPLFPRPLKSEGIVLELLEDVDHEVLSHPSEKGL